VILGIPSPAGETDDLSETREESWSGRWHEAGSPESRAITSAERWSGRRGGDAVGPKCESHAVVRIDETVPEPVWAKTAGLRTRNLPADRELCVELRPRDPAAYPSLEGTPFRRQFGWAGDSWHRQRSGEPLSVRGCDPRRGDSPL